MQDSNSLGLTTASPGFTKERKIIVVLVLIILVLGAVLVTSLSENISLTSKYNSLLSNYDGVIRQPISIVPPPNSSIVNPNTPTPPAQTVVWNSCLGTPCVMSSLGWRQYVVPDTFDLHVSFTSNVSIIVYFLTLGQYAQLLYCGNISCVSGAYQYIPASMKVSDSVFKLAEACADYVAIFHPLANGVMSPNIAVTYNPAPRWTGICQITGPG